MQLSSVHGGGRRRLLPSDLTALEEERARERKNHEREYREQQRRKAVLITDSLRTGQPSEALSDREVLEVRLSPHNWNFYTSKFRVQSSGPLPRSERACPAVRLAELRRAAS